MSRYLDTLYNELRACMVAAVPDLLPGVGSGGNVPKGEAHGSGGVWVVQHVNRIPFETLFPPFGVIEIQSFTRSHEWGVGNAVYDSTANLYIVTEQSWDSLELAAYLESLRDYMEVSAVISNGQVNSVERVDWSDELEANRVLAEKNSSSRAGMVTVNFLIGEHAQVDVQAAVPPGTVAAGGSVSR